MPQPSWLPYGLAVVMMAVAAYGTGRLALAARLGRRNHYDVTLSHVLMGAAMVGMLVPRWNVLLPTALWIVVFSAIAIWFLSSSVRFIAEYGVRGVDDAHAHHVSHDLIHFVLACTMLYMYWLGMPVAAASGRSMSMTALLASTGDPGLTLTFVTVLLASAVRQLDGVGRFAHQRQLAVAVVGGDASPLPSTTSERDLRPWLAPRLEVTCHILMCLTMGYMLILAI
jgi:hypothetical protein